MKNVDEIVIGANGSVYSGPLGTDLPAGISDELDAAFTDMGFTSEDGVTFTDGKTLENIPVWQLFGPARRIVTERDVMAAFVLRQWNHDTVTFAFGGGEVTEADPVGAPGEYEYLPPEPADVDERILVIEWQDGDKDYRLLITRGMVTDNVETNLVRTAAADLPITFGATFQDDVPVYRLQTNDPAFAPPAPPE